MRVGSTARLLDDVLRITASTQKRTGYPKHSRILRTESTGPGLPRAAADQRPVNNLGRLHFAPHSRLVAVTGGPPAAST